MTERRHAALPPNLPPRGLAAYLGSDKVYILSAMKPDIPIEAKLTRGRKQAARQSRGYRCIPFQPRSFFVEPSEESIRVFLRARWGGELKLFQFCDGDKWFSCEVLVTKRGLPASGRGAGADYFEIDLLDNDLAISASQKR